MNVYGWQQAGLTGLFGFALLLTSGTMDEVRSEPRIEVVPALSVPVPRPVHGPSAPPKSAPQTPRAAVPLPVKRAVAKKPEKKPWDALPPAPVGGKAVRVSKSKCDRLAASYKLAYGRFNARAGAYWALVSKKRSLRRAKKRRGRAVLRKDYVLSYPPEYKGPKKPKCLIALEKRKSARRKRRELAVVADYLGALKREYGFVPRVVSEKSFKTFYARESLALGLTAEQVVGVYALETGGIGPYARLSGIFPVDYNCKKIEPRGRAASTALGYAQLLAANSNAVLKSHGHSFAKRLEFQALMEQGARARELRAKAKLLRRIRRDIAIGIKRYSRRNNWREFIQFGKTPKGYAAHAMNLDPDVGPMMQVQKLKKIVEVATNKGHAPVSAAELELLNLVGYGRGLEMLTRVGRGVPTSNFFSRGGYNRNPVSKNLTAEGLLKKIDKIIDKRLKNCGSVEFHQAFREVEGGKTAAIGKRASN